jgi:hypothetical protein
VYGLLKYFLCGERLMMDDDQCANDAASVRHAQYFFLVLYVAHIAVTFATYIRVRQLPPWSLGLLTLSKRVHSIFVVRIGPFPNPGTLFDAPL